MIRRKFNINCLQETNLVDEKSTKNETSYSLVHKEKRGFEEYKLGGTTCS